MMKMKHIMMKHIIMIFSVCVIFALPHSIAIVQKDSLYVEIEKPRAHLYVNDKEILPIPLDIPIVLGKVTVRVNCPHVTQKVKFIVDGETQWIDYDYPFEWVWDENVFGFHTLKVKAFDQLFNSVEDEIKVFIYNYRKEEKWPLTDSNIHISDIPTVRDFIPIGIVHMETEKHILRNLPDPRWGLQCFIFVAWGETADKKHSINIQGRIPIEGAMYPRILLDGKWYILPATKAPMYIDDEKRYFDYPTVYTKGATLSSVSYDEKNRTWIFRVTVPSKGISIKIIGEARGVPFWMGKAEGPYIVHGVSCKVKDIDTWGGFWDVGYCTIYLHTPTLNYTFHGNFLFDRAYHRSYYTKNASERGALAYFSCMYIHGEKDIKFDLMFSHSINPSPLEIPVKMQHQARINFIDRNLSYPLDNFTFSDDGSMQPSTFYFDGRFKDGEIHLTGKAIGYWPPQWGVTKGLWWNSEGIHNWGRAFVVWDGTIRLHGEIAEVKNASSIGEFTRYMEG